MQKIDWFQEIADRLPDYSDGDIWSTGDEILCKTESEADALADMLSVYIVHKEKIFV